MGSFDYGTTCTLVATANEGYTFVSWAENGETVSTEASYSFIVTGNRSLVANFTLQTYAISVLAFPTEGGTVTGDGSYNYGAECSLTATANEGYSFVNWTENGTVVSTETTYVFVVTGDRSIVANFEALPQLPTGAINGLFTVNALGDKVYFSQGNLQYIGSESPSYWKFAENQWEYLGNSTGQGSANHNVNRDLFGWGTSGYHDSNDPYNTNYYPYSTSKEVVNTTYNSFGYGPSTNMPSPNLTEDSENYDWGVYNPISNGGNMVGQWRTLTREEWGYVFNNRNTASGMRYVKAQIVGTSQGAINGIILLPDDWSSTYYPLINSNQTNVEFSSNKINSSVWKNTLEVYGAVFLPATGYRDETTLSNLGSYGCYWSSTKYSSNSRAFYLYFNNSNVIPQSYYYRYYGICVRLVCPAEK